MSETAEKTRTSAQRWLDYQERLEKATDPERKLEIVLRYYSPKGIDRADIIHQMGPKIAGKQIRQLLEDGRRAGTIEGFEHPEYGGRVWRWVG